MTYEHNPTDPLAQERAAANHVAEKRRQEAQDNSDLCKVMSTKEGRRFMWQLLATTRLHELSYRPGADATEVSFLEGVRNVGLNYLARLEAVCPQLYALMQTEQKQLKERYATRSAEHARSHHPRR